MRTSKLNRRKHHKHTIELPIFSVSGSTTLELYPRMRPTELYHQASIPEEYQSRDFEHPHNLDDSDEIPIYEYRQHKIIPPKNSEMRVMRNSYFS